MATTSLFIPLEVIYNILDRLSLDVLSLHNCSLVSPPFLSHCRKLLFSEIRLVNPASCRRLHSVVVGNLTLASYIRKLEVISNPHDEYRSRRWVTVEHTLAPLLQMLHNLHSFTLRDEHLLSWSHLPSELRLSICSLSSSTLTLSCVESIPIEQLLGRNFMLKGLTLNNCRPNYTHPLWPLSRPSPSEATMQPGYLKSLKICDSPRCWERLCTTLTHEDARLFLTRLKYLELSENPGQSIFQVAGKALQEIVLTGLGDAKAAPIYGFLPSFDALPSLLSLSVSTKFSRGHANDPLPHLAHALSKTQGTSMLMHLNIHIDFYDVWKFAITSRDVDSVDCYEFWPEFDRALTRPNVFSNLVRVNVTLNVGGGSQAFASLPARRLNDLMNMGILIMTFLDDKT